MNLTGQPVYRKGQKRKRRAVEHRPESLSPLQRLAARKGSDAAFLEWLKKQPSAIDRGMDFDPDTGKRWCDPCHFRTAKNAGTGCKPEYSAIPLTHRQHLEQHRVGQFAFRPREWWLEQIDKYLRLWIAS